MSPILPLEPLAIAAVVSAIVWTALIAMSVLQSPADGNWRMLIASSVVAAALLPSAVVVLKNPSLRAQESSLGTHVSWLTAGLLIAVTLSALARSLVRSGSFRYSYFVFLTAILMYWMAGAISNIYNDVSPPRLIYYAMPLILASCLFLPDPSRLVLLLRDVSIGVCGFSLLLAAIYPDAAYYGDERTLLGNLVSDRLSGLTWHPNYMGLLAAVAIVTALSRPYNGAVRFVAPVVGTTALIMTQSRSGWLAAAVGVVILGVMRVSTRLRTQTGVVIALTAAALCVLAGALVISESIVTNRSQIETFNGRTKVWKEVESNWTSSPVLGHGTGLIDDPALIGTGNGPNVFEHAHNQVLQSLYSTGLFGLLIFAFIVIYWFLGSLRQAVLGDALPLALLAAVLAYGTFEPTLIVWSIGPVLLVFLFGGLVGTAGVSGRRTSVLEYAPDFAQPAVRRSGQPSI